ncbi:FMN-binding glutamate synthase family protein [Dongshaea marina]|uniref:FMN-binding glutamate synthase family protein n=1 Tax=Dongshaea marina TaxID=2047966 RepID=UPI000D3E522E|nr:FMN-binding glutamate synthase family protein [Dongshaea marina]
MTDRRKWYLGFGIILLVIIALLLLLHTSLLWIGSFLLILVAIYLYDIIQTKHTILRNFPILGHMRFILEFFRPEIQQYFIADDKSEMPFDRATRSVIYERAKGINDTTAFGTERDILNVGYEWVLHSLAPADPSAVEHRLQVGGKFCKQPYSASRLNVSAMSFGALSKNAIMAINKGAALGGFYQNTGEGGLTDHHLQGGDIVLQIGTGYFGVRNKQTGEFDEEKFAEKAALDSVKMIEIKLSQGAKPAHGGVLPAAKITQEIAEIRGVELGKDVISPPVHTAFSGPDGLCHFIEKLRGLSEGKPIGFKLCIGSQREFLSICKAMISTQIFPDFITIDGSEGGTGAAPLEYADHMGMPLDDALVFVNNALIGCGIRHEITLIASGKVSTGFDMVKKLALGADLCNSARAMMMAVGCIQSKQCNKNTCPVGVATQNRSLYKNLDIQDKMHRVRRYHDATLHNFREIIGSMGLEHPGKLCPSQLLKRTGPETVRSYADIYPRIEPGCLLREEAIPQSFKTDWDGACETKF